ncbi:IEC3 subunit of the Ino80 complex, chromatin re-modelling-domain-containing protein [Morchella snyderi]|nr:IEC3 subunit of the Ino80 complex, chromatin re-modelling-domain-containing protein [Morchella snyderi]
MSTEHGTSGGGDKAHYKSYKKKYRKLRFKFHQSMKRSDELFKQEQTAKAAVRRILEENTRLLDLLVDLNSSTHIPKERRFNLGSPSCPTPTRFLSPTLLATIPKDEIADEEALLLDPPVNGALQAKVEAMDADTSSTSSDSDNEGDFNAHSRRDRDSDNEDDDMDDDDDREAYLEEIRETNYKRGIPGTPPRYVRDQMKADADRERKEAVEQARMAAEQAKQEAIDSAAAATAATAGVKQEPVDENMEDLDNAEHPPPQTPPRKPISLADIYPAPGHTPPYLRDPSPFLMSLEEEEAFYYNIDENLGGDIPTNLETSPSSKTESDPRNPMSVYCWLRKYQPQVFLQEGEGEKKPRGRGGRKKAGHDGDSGDEVMPTPATAPQSAAKAGGKRRRADTMKGAALEDSMEIDPHTTTPSRGRGGGRGRGGRRREGEPPVKKQRSVA